MSLNEVLDSGLASIPGCRTLCYVDMPSGLVLGASSHRRRAQEVYDRVADLATKLFHSKGFAALSPDTDDAGAMRQFIVFGKADAKYFVQAGEDPDHVLCYICDLSAEPEQVSKAVVAHRQQVADVF